MRWFLAVAMSAVMVLGCQDEKPSTLRQRQDEAMRDPFNYSPHPDRYDVSGGGMTDFKRKEFKRDVDAVLNP